MRYVGQGHEVRVPVPAGMLTDAVPLAAEFEREYARLYGRVGPSVPVEAINWRIVSSGPRPPLELARAHLGNGAEVLKGTRRAWFPSAGGFVETPVYDRYGLRLGTTFAGPAIVEEREATVVVWPGQEVTVTPELALKVA
jgi:N-methylhydantoinase A